MACRRRFSHSSLFSGLNLNGETVADLACGSGHNSTALREFFPNVRTTGYDISYTECIDNAQRRIVSA